MKYGFLYVIKQCYFQLWSNLTVSHETHDTLKLKVLCLQRGLMSLYFISQDLYRCIIGHNWQTEINIVFKRYLFINTLLYFMDVTTLGLSPICLNTHLLVSLGILRKKMHDVYRRNVNVSTSSSFDKPHKNSHKFLYVYRVG